MQRLCNKDQLDMRVSQYSVRTQSQRLEVLSCIVSSHYLAMTSEQTEDFTRAVVIVIYRVLISENCMIICSYEL
jgi:hypothetical protein